MKLFCPDKRFLSNKAQIYWFSEKVMDGKWENCEDFVLWQAFFIGEAHLGMYTTISGGDELICLVSGPWGRG